MNFRRTGSQGFTLVELLVALSVMAILSVMSWRGLDGMARTQNHTRQYSDELLTLQTGLAQWGADLDALAPFPGVRPSQQGQSPRPLDWNGQVMRMTRYSAAPAASGLRVVAWTRREQTGRSQWLRWQSAVLRTQGELQTAWDEAGRWAQYTGHAEQANAVVITPLIQWQIFYFRDEAWSHPLSSDNRSTGTVPAGLAMPGDALNTIPDGIRLVLSLPSGQALSGDITRDWVRPSVGGHKS